jgi:hypothetical protein
MFLDGPALMTKQSRSLAASQVHSSLEPVPCADFSFPVHFNNQVSLTEERVQGQSISKDWALINAIKVRAGQRRGQLSSSSRPSSARPLPLHSQK